MNTAPDHPRPMSLEPPPSPVEALRRELRGLHSILTLTTQHLGAALARLEEMER